MTTPTTREQEDRHIAEALSILESRLKVDGTHIDNGTDAKNFFALRMGHLESEQFHAAFLTLDYRLIEARHLFSGTIDRVDTSARDIIKAALSVNAARILIAHNHPSVAESAPSDQDIRMTKHLIQLCASLDIELLDHYVVTGTKVSAVSDYIKKENRAFEDTYSPDIDADVPDFIRELITDIHKSTRKQARKMLHGDTP